MGFVEDPINEDALTLCSDATYQDENPEESYQAVMCDGSDRPVSAMVEEALRLVWNTTRRYAESLRKSEQALAIASARVARDRQQLKDERNVIEDERMALQEERKAATVAIMDERSEVLALREAAAADRVVLEAEAEAVERVCARQRQAILLDVGGVQYKTTRATLRSVPGSMLDAMFSGRHEDRLDPDEDGCIFIDRDGVLFGHIIAFLRQPSSLEDINSLPEREQKGLMREADYFGLLDAMFPECATPEPTISRASTRIAVIGGWGSPETVELLNVSTMTFSRGPDMPNRRSASAAAMLDADRLIVIGGYDGSSRHCTTEVMDFNTMSFSSGPIMNVRRSAACAEMIDHRRLLVVGGDDGTNKLDTTEVLDIVTMQFTPGPRMGARRSTCAVAKIDATRLIVVGGDNGSHALDTTEVLDLRSMQFTHGPRLSARRRGCAAGMLDTSRLVVVGGHEDSNMLDTTEILDLSTMSFSHGPRMSAWRRGCALAKLDEDRLLVAGGSDGSNRLDSTEILNVKMTNFTVGPRMNDARSSLAAVCC